MAAIKRASELLSRLPAGPVMGAEIGIWKGRMAGFLLRRPDLTLYMVDHWQAVPGYEDYGLTDADQIKNHARALDGTAFAKARRIVLHKESWLAAMGVDDESLDFVFIDADHSYAGVEKDIKLWMPKLKRGGLLSGHDYDNPNEKNGKEVKRAVDDAVAANNWNLEIGEESTWFVRLPA
jgi:hypothetical protein